MTDEIRTEVRPLLLDVHEAAMALRICEKTLWSLSIRERKIPFVKIGRRTLYDPRDLERWIDSQKAQAPGGGVQSTNPSRSI